MKVLSGQSVADLIYKEVAESVEKLSQAKIIAHLAVVVVGNDPVSEKYIETKAKKIRALGLEISIYRLAQTAGQEELADLIKYLNADTDIHGILVQLPLPNQMSINVIKSLISEDKDVDGFLMQKYNPPAPQAIVDLLDFYKIPLKDVKVLLVGFGALVGEPVSKLLEQRGADISISTNTTADLAQKIKSAKIVISAVGKPKLINKDLVNKDQIIIDAGTASEGNATVGDVDFAEVSKIVEAISPVPGGIGPITVAELARNIVWATLDQNNL